MADGQDSTPLKMGLAMVLKYQEKIENVNISEN